jgi:acetylornithine deacetylase/succinyl-diaminopimelate desuccinylase-like protein
MMRGATDGAFLRAKGIAVYGVPVFGREGEPRFHGNYERISIRNLHAGTELLLKVVLAVAAPGA